MRLIRPYKSFEDILKMSILDNFLDLFFQFDLYAVDLYASI